METWLANDSIGKTYKEDLIFRGKDDQLYSFKFKFETHKIIGYATDGKSMLDDFSRIASTYGLPDTYSWHDRYMEIE